MEFEEALQAELEMDAGPILRDIMLGSGDDIFQSLPDLSITSDNDYEQKPASPRLRSRRNQQDDNDHAIITRNSSGGRRARPNYAVLAGGKCRQSKGESVSSDEVSNENDFDFFPCSPGSTGDTAETDEAYFSSRGSCMSKNAIAARENRLKKKLYLDKLERSVRSLSTENTVLKRRSEEMAVRIEDLTEEVSYLRSVLSNVDEISALVRGIRSVRPTLVSSLKPPAKRKLEDDHDYIGSSGGKRRPGAVPGEDDIPGRAAADGVCIHVADGALSLEFCHRCSTKSKQAKCDAGLIG